MKTGLFDTKDKATGTIKLRRSHNTFEAVARPWLKPNLPQNNRMEERVYQVAKTLHSISSKVIPDDRY